MTPLKLTDTFWMMPGTTAYLSNGSGPPAYVISRIDLRGFSPPTKGIWYILEMLESRGDLIKGSVVTRRSDTISRVKKIN